ncbi:hypothetical protein [Rhodopseudomonas boonkerdii]|uniref:hypothetical protein n=1 Tax=Rhodopseudomonas boonkerdii TaxID=475937 RepID=UPI001E634D46|nr:hypothetical protein [Rhodopseudomonas boonkerdii]
MHQEFVKIRVQQGTDNRIEPVIVVVDPGGEIHHRNATPQIMPDTAFFHQRHRRNIGAAPAAH